MRAFPDGQGTLLPAVGRRGGSNAKGVVGLDLLRHGQSRDGGERCVDVGGDAECGVLQEINAQDSAAPSGGYAIGLAAADCGRRSAILIGPQSPERLLCVLRMLRLPAVRLMLADLAFTQTS